MAGSQSKKVAIIGAGVSGLAAIKACLDEGLEPVCLEQTQHIGGLWHYTDDTGLSRACVFKSLHMISCKNNNQFSDFPMTDRDLPMLLSHKDFLSYLHAYAERYDLPRHIQLRCKVTKVEPCQSDGNGVITKWRVQYLKEGDKDPMQDVFDGVMVGNGQQNVPYFPNIPGMEELGKEVIHTTDYRVPEKFENKKVLVVGIGQSGAEIAVDLTGKAKQVLLSRGQGVWIAAKLLLLGIPFDIMANSRIMNMLPDWIASSLYTTMFNWSCLDHEAYGLKPNYKFGEQLPTVTDPLPIKLGTGQIRLKPRVSRFEPGHVVYEDGTREEIDTLICATGFDTKFKFLPDELLPYAANRVCSMYINTFLPDPKFASLGFIGLYRPMGGHAPLAEMQSRWYVRVLTGLSPLPSKDVMETRVAHTHDMTRTIFDKEFYFPVVNWTLFLDEMAEQIGVKPSPWGMLLRDPRLAWHLLVGPVSPFQYRLVGPGRWSGAREQVLGTMSTLMSNIPGSTGSFSGVRQLRKALCFLMACFGLLFVLLYLCIVMWIY